MSGTRPDHPPTWVRYADLAPLLKGAGVLQTPNDYDYAARCVNVHDDLIETVRWMAENFHQAHHDGDPATCPKNTCTAARDVLAKAARP